MCLQICKMHDIVTDIDRYDSCLFKNANIILINKNANIFFYILDCVLLHLFSLFLDFVSIVAKAAKFEQEYHI